MPLAPAGRVSFVAVICRSLLVLGALAIASVVRAHDPGLSTADGRLASDSFVLVFGFAPADAIQLANPGASGVSGVSETQWRDAAKSWAEVTTGAARLAPEVVRVDTASRDAVKFLLVYPAPAPGRLVISVPGIRHLPPAHRQFAVVYDADGGVRGRKFLTHADATLSVSIGANAGTASMTPSEGGFLAFLWLGVEHIWTGYDHLLFLFGLVVVCRTFRSIVVVISCFTLAHSVTIAAATFGWFDLPAHIVEPAIAASIVYVGLENLIREGAEPRGRWIITLVFGLVHGFGFAGVLRELGVSEMPGGATVPLLAFNLGVECGQIVVAAVALPVLWQLRKRDWFARHGVLVASALVAMAGMYWLLVRTEVL